jgi:hypothetical protein
MVIINLLNNFLNLSRRINSWTTQSGCVFKVDIENSTAFGLIKPTFTYFLNNRFNAGDAYTSSGLNIGICAAVNLYSKGLSPYINII